MAKITLFSARACPFAHRTRLVLSHKNLDFELQEIDLANKPAWFSTVSGYGKVPAIEHEGHHLWESAIINEYLDEVFPTPSLLPREPSARAVARIWIDYANTRLVNPFGALLRAASEADEAAAKRDLEEVLGYIEREGLRKLSAHGPYFLGAEPSLVDFTFYPWFERWPALDHYRSFPVPAEHSRLRVWLEALRKLNAVQAQQSPASFYVERYGRFVPPRAAEKRAQA